MNRNYAVEVTPLIDSAPTWVKLQLDLRKWMSGWIDELITRHKSLPWTSLHDEGIFTRTFPAFYMISGHKPALEYSEMLAGQFLSSPEAEACTCFLTDEDAAEYGDNPLVEKYHGYQSDQSCLVHGPENFCWFLTHMAHISKNAKFTEALRDCTEHIGNFSPDCPPWYDWDNHRFASALLGTKRVRNYPPYNYETLTHVRVMVLATNTYALTGDERYLQLAQNWCDKWADVVLSGEDGFPVTLYPVPQNEVKDAYGQFTNFHKTKANSELAHMFLDLHRIEPNDCYIAAVRKMIEWTVDSNDWGMGSVFAKYRALTGDTSFDEKAVAFAEDALNYDNETPALLIAINPPEESGFGGFDYVRINADSSVKADTRSVSNLINAYQITGDTRYAESSLRLAWMRFWASWFVWDGREFGCRGSWTGRNGVAMHNVIPSLNISASGGFGMVEGELPWMEVFYRQEDGTPGLPEKVAALYREESGKVEIKLINTNDELDS